jgi:hypothetical protein
MGHRVFVSGQPAHNYPRGNMRALYFSPSIKAEQFPSKKFCVWKEVDMKLMSTYSVRPGCIKEATARFLAGEGAPVEGVKLLGRWHKTDGSGGFVLHESDSPEALFNGSIKWADVLEIHGSVVVDDNAAAAAMAKYYGK